MGKMNNRMTGTIAQNAKTAQHPAGADSPITGRMTALWGAILVMATPLPPLLAQGHIKVIGQPSCDFGSYPAWESRTARFELSNNGTEPLRILGLRSTCGCGTLTADRNTLKPGESTGITAEILPNALEGPFTKHVFVESSDASQPLLQLTLNGRAVPLVTVQPRRDVNLGRIPLGTPWECRFELTASREPVRLGTPTLTGTSDISASLSLDTDSNVLHQTVLIKAPPGKTPGEIRVGLEIPIISHTNHPPLRLEVTGRQGDELVALPGIIRLRQGEETATQVFTLRLVGSQSRRLLPADLQLPISEDMTFKCTPGQTPQEVTITVVFAHPFLTRLARDKVISLPIEMAGCTPTTLVCRLRETH